jgi:hypothetical protein
MKNINVKKSLNDKILNDNLLEKIQKSHFYEKNQGNNLKNKNNIIVYFNQNSYHSNKNLLCINFPNLNNKNTISSDEKTKINDNKNFFSELELKNNNNLNNFSKKLFYNRINDYNLKKNIFLPNISYKLKNCPRRVDRNNESNHLYLQGFPLKIPKLINNQTNLNHARNIKLEEIKKKHLFKSKSLCLIKNIKK